MILKSKQHQHNIVKIVEVPDGPKMLVRFLVASLIFQFHPAVYVMFNRHYGMGVIFILEAYFLEL